MRIGTKLLLTLFSMSPLVMAADKPDTYAQFNTLCKERFGAAREPLVYEKFGRELKLLADATWSHSSENSAVLGFSSNLPAVSHIEYGIGDQYDLKTPATERAFYIHLHHLRDLKPGQTYAYRLVGIDEAGKRSVLQQGSVKAEKVKDAIYIPGDLGSPPYNLNKAGAKYVLTRDITSASNAINIMAAGIVLDLNGFTITYDDVAGADPGPEKGFGHFGMQGPHAIRSSYGGKEARILNGSIVQGKGNSGGGAQPIYSNGVAEIAGLNIAYSGSQITGIHRGEHVHHNIVLDAGTELTDRHMGIAAIGGASKAEYNLIKRARQRGMVGVDNGAYRGNEIYIDSYATNSFGIMFYKQKNATCSDNRIFGTGYHPIGIGTVSEGVSNIKIEGNLVHLEALAPLNRSSEYGAQSEAECVRVTWGGENIQYLNNLLIGNADEGGEISGIWHYSQSKKQKDVVYRGNTIKVMRKDDRPSDKLEGAIRICGNKDPEHVPVLIENNKVISNFCNIRLGDGYGVGKNAQFRGNTLVRVGEQSNYATIQIGHGNNTSTGHVFENNTFEGGAAQDKVRWAGEGDRNFTITGANGQPKVVTAPVN